MSWLWIPFTIFGAVAGLIAFFRLDWQVKPGTELTHAKKERLIDRALVISGGSAFLAGAQVMSFSVGICLMGALSFIWLMDGFSKPNSSKG
jgi:hypothetical protein